MNMPQINSRLRAQMEGFLGNLSVAKTARRFSLEAVYGIVARQSLRLSEIARSLHEPTALIQTEKRLSKQAARPGLADAISDHVVAHGARRVGRDTLLVIDPSDLAKRHARSMEHLARVRDGSEGGLVNGYWLCQVVAVECGGSEITPLINHLWSPKAPGHRSENAELLQCIEQVSRHVEPGRGIWVMDRGGDRRRLFEPLLAMGLRFLVRMVGTRHLLYRGRAVRAGQLAARCPLKYIEHVRKQRPDGTDETLELRFGLRKVRLPGWPTTPLSMVVLEGFGAERLMLLSTEPLADSRSSLWWAIQAYLTRWRIEETLRFAKQTYGLEDVRVRSYQGLRNMMALALAAMYFTMAWLGQRSKLSILYHHALGAAQRFFGVPDFRYYTIADGLRELLGKFTKQPFPTNTTTPPDPQLLLFDLPAP